MEQITTTDGVQVTDGNTVVWRVYKNNKNIYDFHQLRARDFTVDSEIFFYKRNVQWRKSNLNKNNRKPCPYRKLVKYKKPSKSESITSRVRKVVDQIKFRDWEIELKQISIDKEEAVMIRTSFYALKGDRFELSHGRWWPIAADYSEDQIVKTIYSAISQATDHEKMKDFKYKGHRVFSPYKDV